MKINIVYAMPKISDAYDKDHDGFSAAMEELSKYHELEFINVHPYNDDAKINQRKIPNADFVLVRSDWDWYPARATDKALKGGQKPVGLLIAGSTLPPSEIEMLRYDVLFYETPWYQQFVEGKHPFAVRAFGIDSRFMNLDSLPQERDIDYLMVGRLANFKRPWLLKKKIGKRVALGDFSSASKNLKIDLQDSGIELLGQVTYQELSEYYKRAKIVFVPCELQGGGERAILEGRACGAQIEIQSDNPKLESLLTLEIPSYIDYSQKIRKSIEAVVYGGQRVSPNDKKIGYMAVQKRILLDKIHRLPSTIKIRSVNLFKRIQQSYE